MDKNEYLNLDFNQKSRIPMRIIWMVVLMTGQWLLWQIVPIQLLRWLLIPFIGVLGWMASFGLRQALRAFRFWLDQVIGEAGNG